MTNLLLSQPAVPAKVFHLWKNTIAEHLSVTFRSFNAALGLGWSVITGKQPAAVVETTEKYTVMQ